MFEKILYPTDFSDVAKKALNFIKQLKSAGAKEVIILHIVDIRPTSALDWYGVTEGLMEIEKNLKKKVTNETSSIEKELREEGFKVKVRIEMGIPVKEILSIEEEENISIIVLGSHGRSNISEMFLGSVSEKVIRNAKKPVLVVKR